MCGLHQATEGIRAPNGSRIQASGPPPLVVSLKSLLSPGASRAAFLQLEWEGHNFRDSQVLHKNLKDLHHHLNDNL